MSEMDDLNPNLNNTNLKETERQDPSQEVNGRPEVGNNQQQYSYQQALDNPNPELLRLNNGISENEALLETRTVVYSKRKETVQIHHNNEDSLA